ncbi:MAG TPA: zf-HC2 domain-containing protein [Spirochaetota bacterium]|nr:zf-HC2 domain-containing protein [Spirochaetota bacterium]
MKCRSLQSRLSEYVDGRLSGELARGIDEHCASCAVCAKELAFLRAYRKRMSTLRTVPAPTDLPRAVNERIDAPEPRRGIGQKLFSPARVKLPLEAAGLLAAAALVFVILVPDESRKTDIVMDAPEHVAVMEKTVLETRDTGDTLTSSGQRRLKKTASTDKKVHQAPVYVIALTLRGVSPSALDMNEARHGRATAREEMEAYDASMSRAKVAAARQIPPAEQKKETADRLTDAESPADVRSAIRRSGGRILEEKCDAATGRCSVFTIEIQAGSYRDLIYDLKGLGEVRQEKSAPKAEAGRFKLRIQVDGN